MKRAISLILAVILLLSLLLTIVPAAYAMGNGHHQKPVVCENRSESCGFVDADNDGLCDNQTRHCGENFVDEDGNGICDNHGETCGRNFTDEDKNGICDSRAENTCPRRQNREGHHGKGRHHS